MLLLQLLFCVVIVGKWNKKFCEQKLFQIEQTCLRTKIVPNRTKDFTNERKNVTKGTKNLTKGTKNGTKGTNLLQKEQNK